MWNIKTKILTSSKMDFGVVVRGPQRFQNVNDYILRVQIKYYGKEEKKRHLNTELEKESATWRHLTKFPHGSLEGDELMLCHQSPSFIHYSYRFFH